MAAIIAQITRQNRERAKKKRYESAKCMYELPPFDPHFDPKIHNKYMARRQVFLEQEEERKAMEQVLRDREAAFKTQKVKDKFSWKVLMFECCVVTCMLSIVPLAIIFIELYWNYGAAPTSI